MIGGSILSEFLVSVSERGRALLGHQANAGGGGVKILIGQCEALVSRRGEATGLALADDVLQRFASLDEEERLEFFLALEHRFGPDAEAAKGALDAHGRAPSGEGLADLHFALEPRRQELFRRLNRATGGTAALVELRKRLLQVSRKDHDLSRTDRDLHHLFSSWFNRGFLSLRQIDWSTPAALLEKIIRYEAVHEIRDWDDLRRRTGSSDRLCFGFFHPNLTDEPLIFVEVALTKGIPASIGPLLAADRKVIDSVGANTAVFYSISNCQDGLRGVSFGNFLIKQVVSELKKDLPDLSTFVTLSPVPGFRAWLERDPDNIIASGECELLAGLSDSAWAGEAGIKEKLEPLLRRLVATYFLKAKGARGEPYDPVARFHLSNGARLERINWMGDPSEQGLGRSAGFMVNYLYDLRFVEKNHEAYANEGTVTASPDVEKLLRTSAHWTREPVG